MDLKLAIVRRIGSDREFPAVLWNNEVWRDLESAVDRHLLENIVVVRPLVVLDLQEFRDDLGYLRDGYPQADDFVRWLKAAQKATENASTPRGSFVGWLADQIKEQAGPPPMEEPKLVGTVVFTDRGFVTRYCNKTLGCWISAEGVFYSWSEILPLNPRLKEKE